IGTAVQGDLCAGLRFCRERQRKCAGHGESDEFLIHGISPLTIRLARITIAPATGTFSGVTEKLTQLCQTRDSIGKLKPQGPKTPVNPVAYLQQGMPFGQSAARGCERV